MINMRTEMAIVGFFLLLCISCILAGDFSEDRLRDAIFVDYNPEMHPRDNNNSAVVVKHGLSLISIVEFDQTKLVIDVWEEMEWRDERLVWFGKPSIMRVPPSRVWIPDIVLYNRPSKRDFEPNVMVNSDGTMFIVPATRLETRNCVSLPKGETECSFKFGSWTYSGDLIDLQLRTGTVDLSNYHSNGPYSLVNVTAERNVVYYACCPESYPDIVYTFRIYNKPKESSWWP